MKLQLQLNCAISTLLVTLCLGLLPTGAAAADIIINELMALNNTTIQDEDGDYSDWLELYNASSNTVDLTDWRLTDDPTDLGKWEFPATNILPDTYLIVFASGKDRRVPGAEMHTGFRLSAAGEYLAAVRPDATIAYEYNMFPPLNMDTSYGTYLDETGGVFRFYIVSTPGQANDLGSSPTAEPVDFSTAGGAFTNTVTVELSVPSPAATIYYTLDGSYPTNTSTVYAAPIVTNANAMIRAVAFEAGFAPGPVRSESYLFLSPDVVDFSSDLPVVVVETFYPGEIPDLDPKQIGCIAIFEPEADGRTRLTNAPTILNRAGFRRRGETSLRATAAKPNLAVEILNEEDDDKNIRPLGLPSESDWILFAPYYFDRTLIRNPFIFELSNQTGRYASRTRFVEVFLSTNAMSLSYSNNYFGVYTLEERIKRGDNRVDIAPLDPTHNTEPEVTGGYILRIDKYDPDKTYFDAGGQNMLQHVYPNDLTITSTQHNWIVSFLDAMDAALDGPNFTDPVLGYAPYIDVDSWIDHNILNMFAMNVDAIRLSGYFFKDRLGKIEYGPIWDFDRSMESCDPRDDNPEIWYGPPDSSLYFEDSRFPWWGRLFQDPDVRQQYVDRWQEFREDTLSVSNFVGVIVSMTNEIAEAQERNFARWLGVRPRTSWEWEVENLTNWLIRRAEWVDSQFLPQPRFDPDGGLVTSTTPITLTASPGATIYYTLDESDPRGDGGAVAPGALQYSIPIYVSENTLITARAYDASWTNTLGPHATFTIHWSAPSKRFLVTCPPELAITELMYDPREPQGAETAGGAEDGDFEFIELQNIGTNTCQLLGVIISDGVTFDFTHDGSITTLNTGEYVVVLRNLAAFTNRYNTNGMNIAGEYTGRLLNNGERMEITGPLGSPIAVFEYDNARGWPVAADGAGHSLVPLVLTNQATRLLDYGGNWRASTYIDGSPGRADPAPIADIVINEVMAHTDYSHPSYPEYDSNDWMEMFNLTASPISLGDWYLSDSGANLKKWAIPSTNTAGANDRITFDEVTGFHNPLTNGFGIDKAGELLYLSYLPGTAEDRIADCVRLKGQENSISLGRYADGETYWYALSPTINTTNAAPEPHVVISRFMYHPALRDGELAENTDDEYVELHNPTGSEVDLWNAAGTWRIDGGIEYSFPPGTAIPAGEYLVLVSFDPADPIAMDAFIDSYGPTDDVSRALGPYTDRLSNRGERIALERPLAPDWPGDPVSWVIVDEVIYFDQTPWPPEADGTGHPLVRIENTVSGNDPSNWQTGAVVRLPRLHWRFNETSGTTATDSSGHGKTGTLLDLDGGNGDGDSPPTRTSGKYFNALTFDGNDDVVRHSGQIVSSYPFTLMAWVKTSDSVGSPCAVALNVSDDAAKYFTIGTAAGMAEIVVRPTARNRYAAVGTTTVSDNEWHHLAGVFINNTNRILYVDGIPEATLAQDVAFFPEIDRCSAGLCDKVAPWSDQWQGGIDDVRVYNETLSQADILAFMAGDGDTQPPDPNEDLDGDGLPDNWEIFYFGSTNAPEGDRDGHADTDGASNWEEYTAGTDPTNATSCLSLAISLSNSCIAVSFPAFTASGLGYSGLNRFYDIEHLGTMHGSWQPLDGATNIPGDNSTVTYTNSFTPAEFFRATTVLQ